MPRPSANQEAVGSTPAASALRAPPTNVAEALVALYMLADYRRVAAGGDPPQPGWFARHGVFTGITASNRGVVGRAIAVGRCVYCQAVVSSGSTGDHVVALDAGGQAGLENYMPCCPSCNSSKGRKDLLEWWYVKGRSVGELAPDVLLAYCRLSFANANRMRSVARPAADTLLCAVRELAGELPTKEHLRGLRQRVDGVVGKRWQP